MRLCRPAFQRVLIIFNPMAGQRRRNLLDAVILGLENAGVRVQMRSTTARGDAERIARMTVSAADPDVDLIAIAGGDGTINEALNGMVGGALPMAVIPLGTANVLAAEIDLRVNAPAIINCILRGERVPVRLGAANGRLFVLMAGAGLDAEVVDRVDSALKQRIGKLAYMLATVQCLITGRLGRFAVDLDGQRHEVSAVVAANAHFYGGKFVIARDARMWSPELHFCLFKGHGRLGALKLGLGMVTGMLERFHDFEVRVGQAAVITPLTPHRDGADHPIQGDGDIIAQMPSRIELSPRCIDLVVPAISVVRQR